MSPAVGMRVLVSNPPAGERSTRYGQVGVVTKVMTFHDAAVPGDPSRNRRPRPAVTTVLVDVGFDTEVREFDRRGVLVNYGKLGSTLQWAPGVPEFKILD